MKKMITVVEFKTFLAEIDKTISSDERDELITYLAQNPTAGAEIQGMGGIRKLRWGGKGKGKRGGLRVIYYFYNESAPVFLLTVYGKGKQENLTSAQKIVMTKLAKILKNECNIEEQL